MECAEVKYKYTNRKSMWDFSMALVMSASSATVYEIFGVEMCMTLILKFKLGQGQM